MTKKHIKTLIIGCILAALVIGFYYYLSNRTDKESAQDTETVTHTQQVLLRNLDTNYPPTPKEVVKYFCEISQCFYNEEHTDEEIEQLGLQIQKLYDEELIANQTQDEYIQNLISEVANMKKNDMVISSYSTSASTDVEEFTEDGYKWARLYCTFSVRKGTKLVNSNERFLLRKDDNGHWKIYGWELAEE